LGGSTETGRFNCAVAVVVAVFYRDVSHGDPDADRQWALCLAIVAFDRLLYPNRAIKCGGGAREYHHETVTEALHLGAARGSNRTAERREVSGAQFVGRLV